MAARQLLAGPQVEPLAPLRRQRVVEGVLVERVDEAEAARERAVGELDLARRLDQPVALADSAQPLLDVGLVLLDERGDERGGELLALDARGLEQPSVVLPQPLDLLADDGDDPLRQRALDRREGAREDHLALAALDRAALEQVVQDVDQEERVAVAAPEDELDQVVGRPRSELAREIGGDLDAAEGGGRELGPGQTPLRQLAEQAAQRMALDLDLRRPVARGDQHRPVGKPRREPAEQVDRGGVRPVQVLEREHQRLARDELADERRELARHAVAAAAPFEQLLARAAWQGGELGQVGGPRRR